MAVIIVQEQEFQVTPDELYKLFDPINPELYDQFGKFTGLSKVLRVDLEKGLDSANQADLECRRKAFGTNSLPEPVSKTLLQFMFETLKDRTLQVLIAAALIKVAVGIYKIRFASVTDPYALIDGSAIVIAVLIVILSGSISDYNKQAQFRLLSDYSKNLIECRVLRDGKTLQIQPAQLVVGDVALLQVGDVVPADGILFQGFNVEIDESTLTGEPISIHKDIQKDPFILSGTRVVNGVGKMLVLGTGVNSVNGRSILALEVEPEETPLQTKLRKIADQIAQYGAAASITTMIILLIIYLSIGMSGKSSFEIGEDVMRLFITAVTIIVVAVPEGLPLAVTLSLAHATVQMLKDNNLVRHLSACETMGNATTICSDKTGTLTMNKMTVTKGLIGNAAYSIDQAVVLPKDILEWISLSANINSSAEEVADAKGQVELRGSKTEIAILDFTKKMGYPYHDHRQQVIKTIEIVPFSSANKSMRTMVTLAANNSIHQMFGITSTEPAFDWVFLKGASEIILEKCSRYMDDTGVHSLTDDVRKHFEDHIHQYANAALRTVGLAIKESNINDDEAFVFVALLGISDPLRPEVPGAVQSCQKAGIVVRMVTGDNINTAKAIAKECGILTEDGIAMEGPVFRSLDEDERNEILPKLQVLARSSPMDKQVLVNSLKKLGHIVAVTGDGTNDAPALTSADVGFSMGIAGTEVAKEASDIILMDDNFASIIKAVLWGRAVFDAIRKFLQFQLTVNVSAVFIAILTSFVTTIGPSRTPISVLSDIQLLWVNLVMNTFAALALATDPPTESLLSRKPTKRSEPNNIISPEMFNMIIGQAAYQILVCLGIYFGGPVWFGFSDLYIRTLVFNTFVFCQIFNEINCRSIDKTFNVFHGLDKNLNFVGIFLTTAIGQVLIIEFCGLVFKTDAAGLDGRGWAISLLVGLVSLPLGFLIRLIPVKTREIESKQLPVERNDTGATWASKRSSIWEALSKTQVRVVNLFQTPTQHKSPNVERRGGVQSGWRNLHSPRTARRIDYTTLQMIDPIRIRQQSRRKTDSERASVQEKPTL